MDRAGHCRSLGDPTPWQAGSWNKSAEKDTAHGHGESRSATRIAPWFIWRTTWDARDVDIVFAVRGRVVRERKKKPKNHSRRRRAERRASRSTSKKKKKKKKLCQRDRSTESTNEDIVGLCLARESLRRRDERGHQRSARAFEVVWASSSSRLGLGLRAKKETRCVWGRRLTVSRAKARPAAPTKYPYVRRARRRAMPRRPRDARQRGRIGASRGLEEARAEPVQVHERDGRG